MIFHEGGKTIGRKFNVVDDDVARKSMEAAGFVDIKEYTYKVCTNPCHTVIFWFH